MKKNWKRWLALGLTAAVLLNNPAYAAAMESEKESLESLMRDEDEAKRQTGPEAIETERQAGMEAFEAELRLYQNGYIKDSMEEDLMSGSSIKGDSPGESPAAGGSSAEWEGNTADVQGTEAATAGAIEADAGRASGERAYTFYDYLLDALRAAKTEIDVKKYKAGKDVLMKTMSNVINDNPELFYVDLSVKGYTDPATGYVNRVLPTYKATGSKLAAYKDNLEIKIRDALSWIEPSMDEIEKALALHEYLTLHAYYTDKSSFKLGSYCAYSPLVEGRAVSQGYALAYKLLLGRAGIESEIVSASTTGGRGHYWNIVKLNGKWYHIDVAWDDADGTKNVNDRYEDMGYSLHDYFLQSDEGIRRTHPKWGQLEQSADDSTYDKEDYFMRKIQKGMFYEDGYWYYLSQEGNLEKTTIKGETSIADADSFQRGSMLVKNGSDYYTNIWYEDGRVGVGKVDLSGGKRITKEWYIVDGTNYESASNTIEITNIEVLDGKLNYVVRDKNQIPPKGFFTRSIELNANGEPSVPAEVRDLNAVEFKTGSVKLSWTAVDGANAYLIYENSKLLAETAKNSYVVKNLKPGEIKDYRVYSMNKNTAASKSVYWMSTSSEAVSAGAITAPPVIEKAESGNHTALEVSWRQAEGAHGYHIYRAEKSNGTYVKIGETSAERLRFLDYPPVSGKTYYYKVRAFIGLEEGRRAESAFSKAKSAKTAPLPAKIHEIVSAEYNSVKLSIAQSEAADGYTVYRAASENGSYKAVKTVLAVSGEAVTSVIVPGAESGKTYYYKVRPYLLNGKTKSYGEYSEAAAGISYPSVVQNFTAEAAEFDSIKLTWNKVIGASGYEILDAESGEMKAEVKAKTAVCILDGLQHGTEYQYVIRAFRKVGGKKIYGGKTEAVFAIPALAKAHIRKVENKEDGILLTFQEVKGADVYEIYRNGVKIAEPASFGAFLDSSPLEAADYVIKAIRKTGGAELTSETAPLKVDFSAAAPNMKAVQSINYDKLKISWEEQETADGYVLYRAEKENAKNSQYKQIAVLKGRQATEYTDTKRACGKTYYYKVRAYSAAADADEQGVKLISNKISGIPAFGKTELGAVSGGSITAESSGYNAVTLTWEKTEGATGYTVYRLSEDGEYKAVKNIGTNKFKNSGLETGVSYSYKIAPYRTVNGKKIYGVISGVTVSETPMPAQPVLASVVSNGKAADGSSRLKISWKKVPGANGYLLKRFDGKDTEIIKIEKNIASYMDSGLKMGGAYTYQVAAYRIRDKETFAGIYSEKLAGTPIPLTPKISSMKKNGFESITLSWKPVEGALGYQIYFSDTKNGEYKKIAYIPAANGKLITGTVRWDKLEHGKTYYFKLAACEGTEEEPIASLMSPVKALKISPDKPRVSGNAYESGKVILNWNSLDADGYKVYKLTKGKYKELADTSGLSVTDADASFLPGNTYSYKVRGYKIVNRKMVFTPYSNVLKVKLLPRTPELQLTAEGKAIRLSWEAEKNVGGYEIYRSTSKTGTYKKLDAVSGAEYTDTDIKEGKIYYYKVRAYISMKYIIFDKTVYGGYSAIVSGKI